jgi:hypothetical protein
LRRQSPRMGKSPLSLTAPVSCCLPQSRRAISTVSTRLSRPTFVAAISFCLSKLYGLRVLLLITRAHVFLSVRVYLSANQPRGASGRGVLDVDRKRTTHSCSRSDATPADLPQLVEPLPLVPLRLGGLLAPFHLASALSLLRCLSHWFLGLGPSRPIVRSRGRLGCFSGIVWGRIRHAAAPRFELWQS